MQNGTFIGCVVALTAFAGGVTAEAATANLPVAADTSITSGAPNNNAGARTWFNAGTDGPSGGNATRRGLLRFDLSSIPTGSTVTSAVLRMTVIKVPGTSPVNSNFRLFRLLADWNEGTKLGTAGAPASAGEATWNARMHADANWTAAGAAADAAATVSASTAVGSTRNATYSWSDVALTADAQFWLDNPTQNSGWLLRSDKEGSSRSVRGFAARQNGVNVPVLEIGFTAPNAPPSVAITSPANGAVLTTPTNVVIEVDADDTDGSVADVEFFDGATSLGHDATDPYAITVALAPGSHPLTAVATDDMGAASTAAVVTVSVDPIVIANPIAERIPKGDIVVELETLAAGLAAPIGIAVPDDGSGRMFLSDQNGLVWVVFTNGVRLTAPLLDVRSRLVQQGAYDERGLLGLATHPSFDASPRIYTYTSEPNNGPADFPAAVANHQSVVTEWSLDAASNNVVNGSSRREILRIDQPQGNHNGGAMCFGPDGYLYIALGDGGAARDVAAGHASGGNGQSLDTVLGKLLRIDVDGAGSANGQYGIPADNPFVGTNGVDEIYAYGFRNPFSFSFDRSDGTLYLGDVGQGNIEEVNVVTKGGNYGWNIKEGSFWFNPGDGSVVTEPVRPVPPGLQDPIAEYDHDDGTVVLAGHVYRGSAIPALAGRFVFGDWGTFGSPSGRLFYLDETNAVRELVIGAHDRRLGLWIRRFGEGPDGELYVLASRVIGPSGNTGRMIKIVPPPDPVELFALAPVEGTNVVLTWTGGAGPVALQQRGNLSEPLWRNAVLTAQRTVSAPLDVSRAFFRTFEATTRHRVPLTTFMTGAAQRPAANNSPGSGSALLSLEDNVLTFNIRYNGLASPATAAHMHGPAPASATGPVLINLQPYHVGVFDTEGVFTGTRILTDTQRAMVLGGRTYVNVHTGTYPGGEIRGQIAPVAMVAALSGPNEVPAIATPAAGLGTFTLVYTQLTVNVTYGGLSAAATAAHIHGPASAAGNAGVMVNLAPYNGGAYGAAGSLAGTVGLTPGQLAAVVDGLTYVNFHTAAHPPGEIRGQVLPRATAVPLTTYLRGEFQRPTPVVTSGEGSGTFALEGKRLIFNIAYANLSASAVAAHIHGPASTEETAGVLVNLGPFNGGAFGMSGTLSGSVMLTPPQRNALLDAQTYVNIHSSAHPGGEIRGQIAPVLMTASLSGINARPSAVATPGMGSGTFALVGNRFSMNITYSDLLSPATATHVHGPASVFGTAGVLVNLAPFNGGGFGASGEMAGTALLTTSDLLSVIDGSTYVNIHTTNFPPGEIRGQIGR